MIKVLVDTDILINYSKGYDHLLENLLEKQSKKQIELYLSPVNITEFFTDKNLINKEKMAKAREFLDLFGFFPITKKIGFLAGEILREDKTSFLGDALIAAACITTGSALVTGNKKHFSKIPGLNFYQ